MQLLPPVSYSIQGGTMTKLNLDPILEGRRSQPHQLIEVLQDVQEQYRIYP